MVRAPLPRRLHPAAAEGSEAAPSALAVAPEPCERFARDYCERAAECSPLATELQFGDVVRCARQQARWCAGELAAPGSGFSEESLADCGRAVAARPCGRWRPLEDLPEPACHPQGPRPNHSACFSGAQCRSGFCAREAVTSGPGAGFPAPCGTGAPVVAPGESCGGPSLPFFGCPLGGLCSRGQCIGPLADEGERCGVGPWYSTCYGSAPQAVWVDSHLECDPSAAAPRCRRGVRPASCAGPAGDCWPEDYCDGDTGRCEPKRPVDLGERCDPERQYCPSGVCATTCRS
ncbi:MAG TPA: hypothetical protein PLU22_10340 [Polyangiaceae bacterium]|nr:hypothetical protein [Polyangiaceae bacterium]